MPFGVVPLEVFLLVEMAPIPGEPLLDAPWYRLTDDCQSPTTNIFIRMFIQHIEH